MPDADSESKLTRTRVDEDRELQEAIMRSLKEGEPADTAAKQVRLSEFCMNSDQSPWPVNLAGDSTYRLVGMISHYGVATHSGHYVADVVQRRHGPLSPLRRPQGQLRGRVRRPGDGHQKDG